MNKEKQGKLRRMKRQMFFSDIRQGALLIFAVGALVYAISKGVQ